MFKNRKRVFMPWSGNAGKGQSLIELALLMPVLVLILAGILDLGRAYMTLVALNDSAAEGAAYAAAHPSQTDQIRARAMDSSNALATLTLDQVIVDYAATITPGNPITVTIQYDYELMTPFINAIVPGGTLTMKVAEVHPIIGY